MDTIRPDHMSVYGYSKNTTPNINKWSQEATVFTNIRTEDPTTYPSFSIFMTGKSIFKSKIFDNATSDDASGISPYLIPISKDAPTLAEVLKKNGYKTAAFINTPSLDAKLTNLNKGFDVYVNDPNSSWYVGPATKEKYKSYFTAMKAIDWLSKNKSQKKFVWIHMMESHSPYMSIYKFKCAFGVKFCNEIYPKSIDEIEQKRLELEGCQKNDLPPDKVDLVRTYYDGAIASEDRLFGIILDKIRKLGLDKNSMIVFYGDHGEGLDHNYYFMHAHELYDSHIKIPFIVRLPSGKKQVISASLTNTYIFPYLLNLLGLEKIKTDLYQLMDAIFARSDTTFYMNSYRTKYAIVKEKYKFIYTIPYNSCLYKNQTEELYDLKKDPNEMINIKNSNKALVKDLKKLLINFMKKNKLPLTVDERKQKEDELYKPANKDTIKNLKSLGY